jgi:hypothetical protein
MNLRLLVARVSSRALTFTEASPLKPSALDRNLASTPEAGSGEATCFSLNCPVNMNRRTFNAQRPTRNIQLSASLKVEC